MSGWEYFIYTALALVVGGAIQALWGKFWQWRARRVDPDDCGDKHKAIDGRLAEGERQFESILLTLDRVDKRVNTMAMAFIFMCEALNHALPPDHKVSCEELIDTLRKT